MIDFKDVFGVAAALLTILGFWRYFICTRNGSMQPNPATWIVFTYQGVVLLVMKIITENGFEETSWTAVVDVFGYLFMLWLVYSYGSKWSAWDILCVIGSMILSGLFFVYTKDPLHILLVNLGADFFGAIPTIRKAWSDPKSEDKWAWTWFTLSSGVNLLAAESWFDPDKVSYPLYFFVANGFIALLFWLPARKTRAERSLSNVPSEL